MAKKQHNLTAQKNREIINKALDKAEIKFRGPWVDLDRTLSDSIDKLRSPAGVDLDKHAVKVKAEIDKFDRQASAQLDRLAEQSLKTGRSTSELLLGNNVNTAAQQKTINAMGRKVLVSKQDKILIDLVKSHMDMSVNDLAMTIGRRHDDIVRQVQLKVIEDIGQTVSWQESKGQFIRALDLKGLINGDGKFKWVELSGRKYELQHYANLLARTTTREAYSNGLIDQLVMEGGDLVEEDVNGDACDICQEHRGIWSISGDSKEYPQLEEPPPHHPFCTCVLMPYG